MPFRIVKPVTTGTKWNYNSITKQSTGYEDELELQRYTHEYYQGANDIERERVINRIFEIYRGKNIFPITYFNDDGVREEILKCIEKDVELRDGTLSFKYLQGIDLCKFLFPNLFFVQSGSANHNSLYDKFMDDHKLKRAIKLVFDMKKGKYVNTTELRNKLELISGNVATNFHPMKAKALYEKYCPPNGVIYDFSCGFGGRMLGALSSKNNYTYYGVEPCTDTYKNLLRLGDYIESVTNREHSFEIVQSGSEQHITDRENFVDFAFSSPPYFSLERYCEEESQCYIKYPTIEEWFIGYVTPTIENIYKYLKEGAYYGVNISDFNLGKSRVEFVEQWIKLSKIIGFEYVETIPMSVTNRRGFGFEEVKDNYKQEGVYIFRKPKRTVKLRRCHESNSSSHFRNHEIPKHNLSAGY